MNYSMSISRTFNTDDTQRLTISMDNAPSTISTLTAKNYIKNIANTILTICSSGHTVGTTIYDGFISSNSAKTDNTGNYFDIQLIINANINDEPKTSICDIKNATSSVLGTAIVSTVQNIYGVSTGIADVDIISITVSIHN